MPYGDGTGPMGLGPMTGRAAGYCAGYGMPGYMNPMAGRGMGRGFGRGRGGGRGWRNRFFATGLPGWARMGVAPIPPAYGMYPPPAPVVPEPETEMQALKNQAEYFEEALKNIVERIKELEAASAKE